MDIVEAQARESDYGRYLCVQFAPPRQRPAMLAVLALAVELGNVRAKTVREPAMSAIRYAWWRDGLDAIFSGKAPPPEPVLLALQRATQEQALSRAPFDELLEGVQREAEGASPGEVAVAIGAAPLVSWLDILGAADADSIAAVQQAGAAWALARRGDAEHAQKHVQAARERRSRVDQRALPALLVATVAEKDRGKVALQLTLLRRALLGRY